MARHAACLSSQALTHPLWGGPLAPRGCPPVPRFSTPRSRSARPAAPPQRPRISPYMTVMQARRTQIAVLPLRGLRAPAMGPGERHHACSPWHPQRHRNPSGSQIIEARSLCRCWARFRTPPSRRTAPHRSTSDLSETLTRPTSPLRHARACKDTFGSLRPPKPPMARLPVA